MMALHNGWQEVLMSLSMEDSVNPMEDNNRQKSTDILNEFFDML